MKQKYIIFLLFLSVFLTACSTAKVVTNNTVFYTPEFTPSGKLFVAASRADVNNSLEFSYYKEKFEKEFENHGYSIVQAPWNADYIAIIAYGINSGKQANVSTPVFNDREQPTHYSVNGTGKEKINSLYPDSNYIMPDYDVVGSPSGPRNQYDRAIALDIVSAESLAAGALKKVYEARATSTGNCRVIANVFDEMLEAMFYDFPGENGKSDIIKVRSNSKC